MKQQSVDSLRIYIATRHLIMSALLAFSLSSCATYYGSLGAGNLYEIDPQDALVVVGYRGDKMMNMLHQDSPELFYYYAFGGPGMDVFLIPVPVGHTFQIDGITVVGLEKARFDNPKPLKLDRHGIYYFGELLVYEGRAGINYELERLYLELLKIKYPRITAQVAPINFEY